MNKCSLDKQLSYFKKAVYHDPQLTDAYYQMGVIYGKQGSVDRQIASYKKVATLDHTNTDIYSKIGVYHFKQEEYDDALRYLLHANELKPGINNSFYYLAKIYNTKEMYERAIYWYTVLVQIESPHSVEACERLWEISKIPDQLALVLHRIERLLIIEIFGNAKQEEIWQQVDAYIRNDQVPEFVQNQKSRTQE